MKMLVLGAGGLLGSALVGRSVEQSVDTVGAYHSVAPDFEIPLEQHDIRHTEAFRSLIDAYQPDAVVNCAALTDVDGCESREQAAFEVNGTAPGELASVCSSQNIQFLHVSTDYVFDGRAAEPYDEAAQPNPIQVYGKSKRAGEKKVREAYDKALIVRLSFVYGTRGDTDELTGFPLWVRDTLRAGNEVPLFVDQQFTPTRAGQAAEAVLDILDERAEGIYHIASRSCVTPYEFGREIARLQGANEDLILESKQSDVSREAARPAYTCLDVTALEEQTGRPQPTLKDDLDSVKTCFDG